MPAMTCVAVRGQLVGSVLSFYRVGSRNQLRFIKLGSMCLFLISHLAGPATRHFKITCVAQIVFLLNAAETLKIEMFGSSIFFMCSAGNNCP